MRYAKEVPGAFKAQDSGNGPPFSLTGWVRTGVSSNTSTQVGAGNCALWTSNSAANNGTTVALNPQLARDWHQPQPMGRVDSDVQHGKAGVVRTGLTEQSSLIQPPGVSEARPRVCSPN